jgi:seryl-tRNA synthetase
MSPIEAPPVQPVQGAEPGGLFALGPEATALLRLLDDTFAGWGTRAGATPLTMPALLPAADLARLDYYDNFPHQAILAAPLDLDARAGHPFDAAAGTFPRQALEPAALALPSAACYAVYLHHAGRELADGTLVTVVGRCFRKETEYHDLRRILGFHMREVIAIGSREHTEAHLSAFTERITSFAEALDLPLRKEVATDPFYDRGGTRLLLQQLSPVKWEFLYDGLAIASVNVHRNFFGERCGITVAGTGEAAFTSCAAFGLERWLSALTRRHGSWEAATAAVEQAARQAGTAV